MTVLNVNNQSQQLEDSFWQKTIKTAQGGARKIALIVVSFLLEAGLIFAVSYLIHKVAMITFGQMLPYMVEEAYNAVVFAPIIEEIFFRSILQSGMKEVQYYSFKWIRGREATDEEKESQKLLRIVVAGALFGLIHLTNTFSSTIEKVLTISWFIFGGIAYGYVWEATGTTSSTILCHSMYNYTSVCMDAGFINPRIGIAFQIIMDVSLFIVAGKGLKSLKESAIAAANKVSLAASNAKIFLSTLFSSSKSIIQHAHA